MTEARIAVDLLICIKCRSTDATGEVSSGTTERPRPGQRLFDRVSAAVVPDGVRVQPVECLSNCNRGCSVALRGTDKWSYVYGNLGPEDADLLLDGASKYLDAAAGLVPWRERSEHFRKNCIARIPPLEI